MTVPNKDEMTALEALVDRVGLFDVLVALDVICGDKAGHLRANWQDGVSARTWETRGRQIIRAAQHDSMRD
jgi:hypothetical protein